MVLNHALAQELGLDFGEMSPASQACLFSGNGLPEGATPFAQAYAGHQFGHFTHLGDGRALMWGEHITPTGARVDIQFKGSGPTPYSRRGDGKAALGPMLREYLISEAMHALGIPTTRSLAVALTGEPVYRETILPGAILTRVAQSHIRVGTFEYAAAAGSKQDLEALVDYTLNRHYPALRESPNKALALLEAVMERQVDLMVNWMRVGFIHGVMNTDNMLLSGETIDYGPCAFMDSYDPHTVFSAIDHQGRYAFANQPKIAQWNLARLAEALLPLIDDNSERALQKATVVISAFGPHYSQRWQQMMCGKLGLVGTHPEDAALIRDLLAWMQQHALDYTTTFWQLGQGALPQERPFTQKFFKDWGVRWEARRQKNTPSKEQKGQRMKEMNPMIIPRNHVVEAVLKAAAAGNYQPFLDFHKALKTPYGHDASADDPGVDDPSLADYHSPPTPAERVYQTFCGT